MIPTIHDAVRSIYSNAITIIGNDVNSLLVYDQNNDLISIAPENVTTELANLQNAYELLQVKTKAQNLLSNTDWVEMPSVTNTTNNPHLINANDFLVYRLALRVIAINPILNPTWPTLPNEFWSTGT